MVHETPSNKTVWWFRPEKIEFRHRPIGGIEIHQFVNSVTVVAVGQNPFSHQRYNLEIEMAQYLWLKSNESRDFYLIGMDVECLPVLDVSGCASVTVRSVETAADRMKNLKSKLNDIFRFCCYFGYFFLMYRFRCKALDSLMSGNSAKCFFFLL